MAYTDITFLTYLPDTTRTVSFLGVEFDQLDLDQAVEVLLDIADQGAPLTYLVTPNVDHLVRLHAEPELRPLYDRAGVTVNDSKILKLIAKLDGLKLPAAPGADIVHSLITEYIRPDERIVVIGGDIDVIEALARDYGIANVAWHEPPMGMRKNPEAVRAAAQFVVDNTERFAFLCVGSPQQEMVAKKAVELGGGKGVALCCGASLDFISGKTDRAPLWMRNASLEWLHRLLSEPKRMWKRYLVDGPRILKIWWRYRSKD
jgi:exopolysaccharide biosynthesis WecB/TagA/CpsF family protein